MKKLEFVNLIMFSEPACHFTAFEVHFQLINGLFILKTGNIFFLNISALKKPGKYYLQHQFNNIFLSIHLVMPHAQMFQAVLCRFGASVFDGGQSFPDFLGFLKGKTPRMRSWFIDRQYFSIRLQSLISNEILVQGFSECISCLLRSGPFFSALASAISES